jgi:hypothetical protein
MSVERLRIVGAKMLSRQTVDVGVEVDLNVTAR